MFTNNTQSGITRPKLLIFFFENYSVSVKLIESYNIIYNNIIENLDLKSIRTQIATTMLCFFDLVN